MDITSNPWVITAADVAAVAVIVWPTWFHCLQVELSNYGLDTDTCDVLNLAGLNVWHGNGAADLETVRSGVIGPIMGAKIPIGGITGTGIVKIYHR